MSDEKLLVSRDLLVRLQEALSTSYCPEKSLCTELWRALLAQPSDGALTNEGLSRWRNTPTPASKRRTAQDVA